MHHLRSFTDWLQIWSYNVTIVEMQRRGRPTKTISITSVWGCWAWGTKPRPIPYCLLSSAPCIITSTNQRFWATPCVWSQETKKPPYTLCINKRNNAVSFCIKTVEVQEAHSFKTICCTSMCVCAGNLLRFSLGQPPTIS